MTHRPSSTSERTSFGMEVVAVALGVGFGVVDAVSRRMHRDDAMPVGTQPKISLDAGRGAALRSANPSRAHRVPAMARTAHA